jgi:hypothetical protein
MTNLPVRPSLPKRTGRRFRDYAALLPITGIFLLATPMIATFTQFDRVFGLPSPFVYVFGIWAGLIISAFFLARRAVLDEKQ